MFRSLAVRALFVSVAALSLSTCKGGFNFTICGTSEFSVKSNGASTGYEGTHEARLSAAKDLEQAIALVDEVSITRLSVEVISIAEGNKAKKATGKIEIGPLDGSQRILAGEYSDVAIELNKPFTVTPSAEAQAFAQAALKGKDHGLKAWVSGSLDSAPAEVTLKVTVGLTGKVGGGGVMKDFGCAAAPSSGGTSEPSCTPNPCRNDGGCSLDNGVPTCTCTYGFGGLKCEKYRSYLPFITK